MKDNFYLYMISNVPRAVLISALASLLLASISPMIIIDQFGIIEHNAIASMKYVSGFAIWNLIWLYFMLQAIGRIRGFNIRTLAISFFFLFLVFCISVYSHRTVISHIGLLYFWILTIVVELASFLSLLWFSFLIHVALIHLNRNRN